jgi:capsular exopolysaccharide synthesis family protein
MSIVERAMERAKQAKAQLTANGPVPAPPMNVKPRFAVKSAAEAPPVEAMPYVDPSPFPIENLDYFKLDMAAIRATGGLPAPECMQDSVDQLRRLKWPLLKAVQGRGGPKEALNNRLMVTSSLPHEGKTFMSLGISLTLAREKGMRVLLIDADVARATQSRNLGIKDRPGLTEILNGEATLQECILRTDRPSLFILPAGRGDSRAPELFGSPRMAKLAEEISEFVGNGIALFDTSPLLATNESQVLARFAGYLLLVVRAGQTPRDAVIAAAELIPDNIPSSAILNGVEYGLMSTHYGYYGYYGPYGKKYGTYRYGEEDSAGGSDANELEGEENRAA